MIIREAQPTDANAIAKVHIESWRTTYAGIVPADFLAGLSAGQRTPFWQETLDNLDSQRFTLVAEDAAGQVVGFASGGQERDGDPTYQGELYAIYLLQNQQRQGMGRQLMAAVAERLRQRGLASMLVWVLADNPIGRAFYEAMGGQLLDKEKELTIGSAPLVEVAYGWLDVQELVSGNKV